MKQSKSASLVESIVNILVGFGLSCALQAIVLPALGVPMPWSVNVIFAVIMTAVSLARSFVLRRVFEALHIRRPLSPFMQAVVAERFRQVDAEGFSTAHDDDHSLGELAQAGAAYALYASTYDVPEGAVRRRWWDAHGGSPDCWPWSRLHWKPQNFRRDLVRATALMLAEGERFDRHRKRSWSEPGDWDHPRPEKVGAS